MKKKIFIIHSNMELGGAETSLLGLLQSFNYNTVDVELMLLEPRGELLNLIPKEVKLINTPMRYQHLSFPIIRVIKEFDIPIAFCRLYGKLKARGSNNPTYNTKSYAQHAALPFLPSLEKNYDIAISFIDPHWIIGKKVKAKKKLAWIHFQFIDMDIDRKFDIEMWNACDYIINVSDACKELFINSRPELESKSIVIENILSEKYVKYRANEIPIPFEMLDCPGTKLLSIGRFCNAKNFDNIPFICKYILEKGAAIKWYIIGFGSEDEEQLIRDNIVKAGVEENVIILGKKDNPYPYIKSCNIYVQPSRNEGKSVCVREAQILNKPVVITNYKTAFSQLNNGEDGIIAPMNNKECAEVILNLLNDEQLQNKLISGTKKNDYCNSVEVDNILKLVGEEKI